MLYTVLNAALEAAVVAYFFYPLFAISLFGFIWLVLPSRRAAAVSLFRQFLNLEPEAEMLPGALVVFILTFIWLLALSILRSP